MAQLFGNGQNNRSQPTISASQRRVNRAIQTALNFFEFDAGAVDGVFGQKSRAATSAFQEFMGYEATGHLTHDESQFLLNAYNDIANKDEALALKVSLGLVAPQDLLRAVAEGEIVISDTPEEELLPDGPDTMRSLCVNIGASGPKDLLKAQFCNLRQLAIEQGQALMDASLNGQSAEPVIEECRLFAIEMRPKIEQIAITEAPELVSEMDLWIRRSGVSSDKLTGLSETCLGVAYSQDESEAALASLLVLSGLKDAIYIEQLGYHLALGLREEPSTYAQAQGWMETAVAKLGDDVVSLTGQSSDDRIAVLVDVLDILKAGE